MWIQLHHHLQRRHYSLMQFADWKILGYRVSLGLRVEMYFVMTLLTRLGNFLFVRMAYRLQAYSEITDCGRGVVEGFIHRDVYGMSNPLMYHFKTCYTYHIGISLVFIHCQANLLISVQVITSVRWVLSEIVCGSYKNLNLMYSMNQLNLSLKIMYSYGQGHLVLGSLGRFGHLGNLKY